MFRMIRRWCNKDVENVENNKKVTRTKSKVSFVFVPDGECKDNSVAVGLLNAVKGGAQHAIHGNLEASKEFSRTFSEYSSSKSLPSLPSATTIMLHGDNLHNDQESDC